MQLSKNFQLSEFSKSPVTPAIQVNLILLARQLQALRDYFNTPVKIAIGVSSISPEHQSGKAAVFSVNGKSADQIKAALEALIAQEAVYNGTIMLLNGNQVYYSLVPIGGRADKRTGGGGGSTGGNDTTPNPPLTRVEQTNKNLITIAMVLGVVVVGSVVFKRKK